MNPVFILEAVEAAVGLGRKLHAVLVDETAERSLLLPAGNLFASVTLSDARDFFDAPQNRPLVDAGGPYHGLSDAGLVLAYKTLMRVEERLEAGDAGGNAAGVLSALHRFEQYRRGFGARPAAQRLLGTLVEIGIDFFGRHPEALGRESKARRVAQSFLAGLDDVELAEGRPIEIVGDLFRSALDTLGEHADWVGDDRRLQVLVGGVSRALLQDLERFPPGMRLSREDLLRRVGSSLLRGGAEAVTGDLALFWPGDAEAKKWTESALVQVLAAMDGREDVFQVETVRRLFSGTLRAVAANPSLAVGEPRLQRWVASGCEAAAALCESGRLREPGVGWVAQLVVDTVREPVRDLLRAKAASHDWPAMVLWSVVEGLDPMEELSPGELERLLRNVMRVVVRNADAWLVRGGGEEGQTALKRFVSGVMEGAREGGSGGGIAWGELVPELLERLMPVAAEHLDRLESGSQEAAEAIRMVAGLAEGALRGRITSANAGELVVGALAARWWDMLDFKDAAAVEVWGRAALRLRAGVTQSEAARARPAAPKQRPAARKAARRAKGGSG